MSTKQAEPSLSKTSSEASSSRCQPISQGVSSSQTFTITFGDQAENHAGMQKIGSMASCGFKVEDLQQAKSWFESRGITCELILLAHEDSQAYVLVARNGLKVLIDGRETAEGDFFSEQAALPKDRKAFMYGRVVEKHARHNLCFSELDQEPDYESGKGRIIAFDRAPLLKQVRETLPLAFGEKARNLQAEGNYYYDIKKCGIGFHGDTERRLVVGVRVGASLPLHFVWFQQSKPVSAPTIINLRGGDVYAFEEKAVGQDWRKKTIFTLRHATGCLKFLKTAK